MLWVIACLTAVVLIAITIAVSYLKPERLTPLVEKYANEYLVNADINIGRIEISFWHTFPRFELDITDFSVKVTHCHPCHTTLLPGCRYGQILFSHSIDSTGR